MSPESRRPDERDEQRDTMKRHFAETGSLDAPGVPDEMKREYAREHLEAAEREVAQMTAKLEDLLRRKHEWSRLAKEVGADAASAAERAAFTDDERRWFREGEREERMLLQESWEATGSLDIDDVADEEKAAFAKEKLAQLRAAIETGHISPNEQTDERLARLEILMRQYGGE